MNMLFQILLNPLHFDFAIDHGSGFSINTIRITLTKCLCIIIRNMVFNHLLNVRSWDTWSWRTSGRSHICDTFVARRPYPVPVCDSMYWCPARLPLSIKPYPFSSFTHVVAETRRCRTVKGRLGTFQQSHKKRQTNYRFTHIYDEMINLCALLWCRKRIKFFGPCVGGFI